MKVNEIKVGHIYFVDYEPVHKGEFGKTHLAIVLKQNANKITFITVPLTSADDGVGINKVSLGILDCLPKNLQEKETFVVLDQVRTANADRFMKIKENGEAIDVKLPKEKMILVYRALIKDLLHDVEDKEMLLSILLG